MLHFYVVWVFWSEFYKANSLKDNTEFRIGVFKALCKLP